MRYEGQHILNRIIASVRIFIAIVESLIPDIKIAAKQPQGRQRQPIISGKAQQHDPLGAACCSSFGSVLFDNVYLDTLSPTKGAAV